MSVDELSWYHLINGSRSLTLHPINSSHCWYFEVSQFGSFSTILLLPTRFNSVCLRNLQTKIVNFQLYMKIPLLGSWSQRRQSGLKTGARWSGFKNWVGHESEKFSRQSTGLRVTSPDFLFNIQKSFYFWKVTFWKISHLILFYIIRYNNIPWRPHEPHTLRPKAGVRDFPNPQNLGFF